MNQRFGEDSDSKKAKQSSITNCWFIFDILYTISIVVYVAFFIFWIVKISEYLDSANSTPDKQVLQSLFDIWKKPFIIDIQLATSSCPSGYVDAINYTWPGTNPGCSCSYDKEFPDLKYLVSRNCTPKLLQSFNCQDLPPKDELKMHIWKGSRICIKQSTNNIFEEQVENCNIANSVKFNYLYPSQTYKMCGFGESTVCVRQNESCPINYLGTDPMEEQLENIKPLKINEDSYYYYGIINDQYPIQAIKVDEYRPCDNISLQNISPNRSDHQILKIRRTTCESGQDWSIIDNMPEKEFYQENTEVYDQISSIPGYSELSAFYQLVLATKPYPNWSYNCRKVKKYSMDYLNEQINPEEEEIKWKNMTITNGIALLFIFFLPLINCGQILGQMRNQRQQTLIQKNEDQIRFKSMPIIYRMNLKMQIFMKLIKILQIPTIVIALFSITEKRNYFEQSLQKIYKILNFNQFLINNVQCPFNKF